MRLIDADIATDAISNMREEPEYKHLGEDWKIGLMHAEDILDEQPTVDAIPISYLAEEYTLIMKILKWRHDINREYREELKREAKYLKGWINHYRYEQGLGFNGWLWKAVTDEELEQMAEEEHDTAD